MGFNSAFKGLNKKLCAKLVTYQNYNCTDLYVSLHVFRIKFYEEYLWFIFNNSAYTASNVRMTYNCNHGLIDIIQICVA